MATVDAPKEQRFVLRNINWARYRSFADSVADSHVRLTYDRGKLEFMTLSHGHERCSNVLGRFVETLTEELDMPLQSGQSTTFGREDVDRALEPDQCYYITNEPLVRDKDEIDLTIDPPPDLAIEVEVTRSAINRMVIYAALRVPEVWRFDGEGLYIYNLGADGKYVEVERSRYFPFLPMAAVLGFLQRRTQMDETSLVRSFRRWVREQIASGWQADQ